MWNIPCPAPHRLIGVAILANALSPTAGELSRTARSPITYRGLTPKALYFALQLMHRAALIGWGQIAVLALADRLCTGSMPEEALRTDLPCHPGYPFSLIGGLVRPGRAMWDADPESCAPSSPCSG
jgi:hypothetical protein